MTIMCRIDQTLQRGLEGILIVESTLVDVLLNPLQPSDYVNGRLLISWRRVLQVGQSTLELDGIVNVLDEIGGHSRVEWYAGQTVVGLFSRKGVITCRTVSDLDVRLILGISPQDLTMSPQIVGKGAARASMVGEPLFAGAALDGSTNVNSQRTRMYIILSTNRTYCILATANQEWKVLGNELL